MTSSTSMPNQTPAIVSQCALTAAALQTCAECSTDEGLACSRNCRPTAAIVACIQSLYAMRFSHFAVFNQLLAACKTQIKVCAAHCAQHANEHCKRCAAECSSLAQLLENVGPAIAEPRITSAIGM